MICACDIGHSLCEVLTVCYAFLCRVFRKVAYTRNETFNKSPTRRCVCRIVQRSFLFTCCETYVASSFSPFCDAPLSPSCFHCTTILNMKLSLVEYVHFLFPFLFLLHPPYFLLTPLPPLSSSFSSHSPPSLPALLSPPPPPSG